MVEPHNYDKQIKSIDLENRQVETAPEAPTDATANSSTVWHRSLWAQSMSWLGGIGLLGSSLVLPQHNSGTAMASPKMPELLPKAVPTDSAPPQRAAEPVFIQRSPAPSVTRKRPRSQNRVAQSGGRDYSNSYIDPTDYNIGATRRGGAPTASYRPPSSVVFSERYRSRQRAIAIENGNNQDAVASFRPRRRNRGTFNPGIRENSGTYEVGRVPRTYETQRRYRVGRTRENDRQINSSQSSRVARNNRRLNSSPIVRVPRSYEAERQTDRYQIVRVPRSYEVERPRNPYQIVRVPRSYEVERPATSERISAASRRRYKDVVTTRNNAARRRGIQIAASERVRIGPIATNPDRSYGNRNRINRQNTFASSDLQAQTTYQDPPNPALRYYYDSTYPQETTTSKSNLALTFPLAIPSQITSVFGWRTHPLTGERGFHAGTDLGAPMGTPVLAAHAGKVAIADLLGGYGLAIVLRHNQNSQETRYGHLSEIYVKPGEWVEPGTVIGRVGNTGNSSGPHLHFEVREQTPQGWVAKDPGTQLEIALSRLVGAFQTAQSPQLDRPSEEPRSPANSLSLDGTVPQIPIPNAELPEIGVPRTFAPPPLFQAGG